MAARVRLFAFAPSRPRPLISPGRADERKEASADEEAPWPQQEGRWLSLSRSCPPPCCFLPHRRSSDCCNGYTGSTLTVRLRELQVMPHRRYQPYFSLSPPETLAPRRSSSRLSPWLTRFQGFERFPKAAARRWAARSPLPGRCGALLADFPHRKVRAASCAMRQRCIHSGQRHARGAVLRVGPACWADILSRRSGARTSELRGQERRLATSRRRCRRTFTHLPLSSERLAYVRRARRTQGGNS